MVALTRIEPDGGQRVLRIRQFALPHTTQQFFGLLLEIFQIRFFR